MRMQVKNCWEVKNCGRHQGGAKAADLGVCSAYRESRLDSMNRGMNGGRSCWAIAGTLCGGKVQGTFAAKMTNCMQCDFYVQVKREEGSSFVPAPALIARLHQ